MNIFPHFLFVLDPVFIVYINGKHGHRCSKDGNKLVNRKIVHVQYHNFFLPPSRHFVTLSQLFGILFPSFSSTLPPFKVNCCTFRMLSSVLINNFKQMWHIDLASRHSWVETYSPRGKNFIIFNYFCPFMFQVSFIAFLLLYTFVITGRLPKNPYPSEWLLMIWVIALLFEELLQVCLLY